MISYEEVIKQQEDLYELCKDRENSNHELFSPNNFYGMSTILKRYAKIRNNYQIKCVIPHGIVFNEDSVWSSEINFPLPIILCYPKYRLKVYRNNSKKIILNFSSPFVYLDKILKPLCKSLHREGLIYFPAHSTHKTTTIVDHDLIAEKLTNIDKKYQPVSVCIYWKDFLENQHLAYQKRGLKIVSAGHIFDPNFLFRLYYLLSTHKYSASSNIGSSVFYSIKAGCIFHFINSEKIAYKGNPEDVNRDHPQENVFMVNQIYKIFSNQEDEITQEKLSLTDSFLNTKYLISPFQLKLLFIISEPLFFFLRLKHKFW